MKIALKDFQEDAVADLVKQLSYAKRELRDGGAAQAVILASPTGSGKTVITAGVMEAILDGVDEIPAERDAVFLWISDQPELNEQSRKKIVDSSDRFRESDLVVIDSDFDRQSFEGGKLYFINIQKLGRDKILVTKGDKRSYTIWETIRNTQDKIVDKFYLIIDEAHHGMNRSSRDENYSKTVVQKFILGDQEVGLPPLKLILGISATPDRFIRLLQETQQQQTRISRLVQIDPEDVRASGLLKDNIVLFHPTDQHPSDWTLLAEAARQWVRMRDAWNSYTISQRLSTVYPAMVIQVEDRNDVNVTRTNLELVVKTIEEEIGPIGEEEMAHSFEIDADIAVGSRRIKKIEPSRIQESSDIKFIFFKMSLTTGWDCPRAEVMMSFRSAQDHTLIAQLIGRMVRTPLARRVERNELLNSVSLYLPHYNEKEVRQVIEYLKSDPDTVPPTNVEDGNNQLILSRRANCEAIFRTLDQLPTYRVERTRKASNTRRLMKLSRLLTSFHQIDSQALDNSKKLIIETLHSQKEILKTLDPEFDQKVNNAEEIVITPVTVQQGIWKEIVGEPIRVMLTEANISELFNRCGKRLGEGLHMDYWSTYYDPENPNRPKLELFLTLQQKEVFEELEKVCGERISQLFVEHKIAIRSLTNPEQEKFNKIREQAKEPETIEFMAPSQIILSPDPEDENFAFYDRHLYVTEDDRFSVVLNGWERTTIETEIRRPDVVGWIRNFERRLWALCVPFPDGGQYKPMYPDFLVVRKIGDNYIVDILEPHREDLDDNWKKAIGLAKFAEKHWNCCGRIELIRKKGSHLKRLNMNDDNVRTRVLAVTSNDHLDTIFDALSI